MVDFDTNHKKLSDFLKSKLDTNGDLYFTREVGRDIIMYIQEYERWMDGQAAIIKGLVTDLKYFKARAEALRGEYEKAFNNIVDNSNDSSDDREKR